DWLPATITKTDSEGRIIIDLKPNTWISKEDQAMKVRRRREGGAGGAGSRAASPMRNSPSSAGLRAPPPQIGRSPSLGGPGSRPGSRVNSPLQRRSPALAAGAIAGLGSRPGSGVGSRPGSRAASPSGRAPSPRVSQFDVYRKHDLVEYWSVSHGEWLPATVVNTDIEGRIVIDLKPNTWLTKEDQSTKVRRRARVGTPGSQMRRMPSADHVPPARAASPRCMPSPGRAMSPHRAPSPWRACGETPGRAPSPRRPGMPPPGHSADPFRNGNGYFP
ncbi:unnamed protein product, partial [Effrenium voratum]